MGLSISKGSSKGSSPNFVKSQGGTGLRAGTRRGVTVGVRGCSAKRAASNVKATYQSAKRSGRY